METLQKRDGVSTTVIKFGRDCLKKNHFKAAYQVRLEELFRHWAGLRPPTQGAQFGLRLRNPSVSLDDSTNIAAGRVFCFRFY